MNPQIVNYIAALIAAFVTHLLLGYIPATPPDVGAAITLLVGFFTHHFLDTKSQAANAIAQQAALSKQITDAVNVAMSQQKVNASNGALLTT